MSLIDEINKLTEIRDYLENIPTIDIARIFAHLDSGEQAEVIHHIAKELRPGVWCQQNCAVAEDLTPEAKDWIKNLYKHAFPEKEHHD